MTSPINFDPDLKARVEGAYDPEARVEIVRVSKARVSFVASYRARKAQERKDARNV